MNELFSDIMLSLMGGTFIGLGFFVMYALCEVLYEMLVENQ